MLITKVKQPFPLLSSYLGQVLGTQMVARSPQAGPRVMGADCKGDGSRRLVFCHRPEGSSLLPFPSILRPFLLLLC